MLVVLVIILMQLVMEMSIITKKSVATIDRYTRIPFLKAVIVNVIKLHMKSKALGCTIRFCGKDVNVSFLADALQDRWI